MTYYGSVNVNDEQFNFGGVGLVGTGGTPPIPAVLLSPTSITYSSRPVGSTSIATSVSLKNTGNAVLNISSIALAGANPTDYLLTNTCGATLAASATCTFSVSFSPASSGTRTASVQVVTNAATSPDSVLLTGTAQ